MGGAPFVCKPATGYAVLIVAAKRLTATRLSLPHTPRPEMIGGWTADGG
jgi:hypothetical protein